MMSAAFSSISLWSAVRKGSHSAPLITIFSIFFPPEGVSFTDVGKVAPPRPTMPHSRTIC